MAFDPISPQESKFTEQLEQLFPQSPMNLEQWQTEYAHSLTNESRTQLPKQPWPPQFDPVTKRFNTESKMAVEQDRIGRLIALLFLHSIKVEAGVFTGKNPIRVILTQQEDRAEGVVKRVQGFGMYFEGALDDAIQEAKKEGWLSTADHSGITKQPDDNTYTTDTLIEQLRIKERLAINFPLPALGDDRFVCHVSDGVLVGVGEHEYAAIHAMTDAHKDYARLHNVMVRTVQ